VIDVHSADVALVKNVIESKVDRSE
jgi:hypothetical protein